MQYECRFIGEDVEPGGIPREKAAPVRFYLPVTHEPPLSKTEAGVLWSENYIYAFFRAYDKDIYSYKTERDSWTYEDDVLEFFFQTDPAEEPYYNFEINALNTVYDAYNLRRATAGGDQRWRHWNCEGLKSAVTIKGTLNDAFDVDEYWDLDIAVPFSSLRLKDGKTRPDPGDEWLFALSRFDYSVYLPDGIELSSTARFSKHEDFHRFEEWDTLVFIG